MTNKPTETTSDHDLLIRLDTKLEQLSEDIKEMKNTQAHRIESTEKRITNLEDIIQNMNPEQIKKTVDENAVWIHDFKLTWKTTMAIASTIGAVVGFALSVLTQIAEIFGK